MLETIARLSRQYGADSRFVFAGGGNTSCKDGEFLYVKPSGVALATIQGSDFVKLERASVRRCFEIDPAKLSADEREAAIKRLLGEAVLKGGRPSVETPVHEALPFKFIVHLHPAFVNGLTCAQNGKAECAKLFPNALWLDYCDPGFTLSLAVKRACDDFAARTGGCPKVLFLQNHGVFVGGDTPEEIDAAYADIMSKLEAAYRASGISADEAAGEPDMDAVMEFAPVLTGYLAPAGGKVTVVSAGDFAIPSGPLTPDHLVYGKAFGLTAENPDRAAVAEFEKKYGYLPRMVRVPGKAVFCGGKDKKAADIVLTSARNGALIERLAGAFGGVHFLDDRQRGFIENWEVESYRAKVSAGAGSELGGLVAVVTGGAQGFGLGIAQELAKRGASIAVADINAAGAEAAAATLGNGSRGFAVDVSNENSVEELVKSVVRTYGGVDLLISNAGVVRAGKVVDLEFSAWDFVTKINYHGFFFCVKHFARVMSKQNAATGRWSDIVQINSKSGLEGSKNNAAYAASKFGGIGMVQSFALELVADRIKVNAVCPGNYLDGPLWSDPVRGLFVQYLNAGKVPGAKTVDDVRRYYEAKVPMNRGCLPVDVARAIVYIVQQQYETGQALPVTGGQVMMN
jgi:NAD(P)-dependent dehydrogenase (short-subunit alcohol dehydrogenase family)/rhamnose utilization protein RhaD (predicted bifunctional aldolase and dehydrogenase)